MGKQSARIYFQGKDHKEIYYQGHYHDAMYIGSTLVWEKLKAEEPIEKVPLEGFSAICYYNGFYYVAYFESSSNMLYLYQGASLMSLKYVYTIEGWYQSSYNLYIADQYGLTLIRHGYGGIIKAAHFDFNAKLIDVTSVILNNLDRPINTTIGAVGEKNQIAFVYGKYLWYAEALAGNTVYAALHGDKDYYFKVDNMNVFPSKDAFVYDNRIILPLYEYESESSESTHGIDEGIFIYFLTKRFEDAEFELTKVQIPYYIFYNKAVVDLLRDEPDYTAVQEKTEFSFLKIRSQENIITNGYFIAGNTGISVVLKGSRPFNDSFASFQKTYKYVIDIAVNLKNFSFETIRFKDKEDATYNDCLDKIIVNEYALAVYQKYVDSMYVSYLRYLSYPNYDGVIPFDEISDEYDVLKNVSGSSNSKFEFLASYKIGNMIYCSVKKLENYLIQIDTINNTASVIKPQLYLEEE